MIETGKNNIEKLAKITTKLKDFSDEYDELLYDIMEKIESITQLNSSINALLINNELIGAKKVAEYDHATRQSFNALINDDSLEILRSLLEDAKLNLDDLIIYYKQHYLQTVAKQEEQLRKNQIL